MSIESGLFEQLQQDVTITRARYAELIKAEHDADCLKELIRDRANRGENLAFIEIQLLRDLYYESEENN